jgi:hypothetical protein
MELVWCVEQDQWPDMPCIGVNEIAELCGHFGPDAQVLKNFVALSHDEAHSIVGHKTLEATKTWLLVVAILNLDFFQAGSKLTSC